MFTSLSRLLRSVPGFLLLSLGAVGLFAQDDARAAEDVVTMTPYQVTAQTVDFRGWTKLRSPNFIVYSDANLKQVRAMMRQMEMLHLAAQVTFGRRPLNKSPAIVLLPTSSSDWKKVRSMGSVEWKVAASGLDWFQPGSIIEYDWQRDGIEVLWASLTATEMIWLGLDVPFALRKGFGYYFETIRQGKNGLEVGRGNRRAAYMRWGEWMDWERFFLINSSDPEFTTSGDLSWRFTGQAALFVHYILTRSEYNGMERLLRWAALIKADRKPTEARFYETFGMTWTQCEERLAAFVTNGKFNIKVYPFPAETLDFVVTELDVSPREMRELFILIQIYNQKVPASEESLDGVLADGLRSKELRPLLISACRRWGRNEVAMELVEDMLRDDQETSEAYDLMAHLHFERHITEPSLDSRLDSAAYAEVKKWAQLNLLREPLQNCVNEVLCWTEAFAPEVDAASVERIKKLITNMEGNGETDMGMVAFAIAAWRAGELERAERACQLIIGSDFGRKSAKGLAADLLRRMDRPVPELPPEPELPVEVASTD